MQISVLVTILSTLAIVQAGAGGASTATSQIKDSGKGGTAYGGTTGPGGRSGNTGSNAGSADGGSAGGISGITAGHGGPSTGGAGGLNGASINQGSSSPVIINYGSGVEVSTGSPINAGGGSGGQGGVGGSNTVTNTATAGAGGTANGGSQESTGGASGAAQGGSAKGGYLSQSPQSGQGGAGGAADIQLPSLPIRRSLRLRDLFGVEDISSRARYVKRRPIGRRQYAQIQKRSTPKPAAAAAIKPPAQGKPAPAKAASTPSKGAQQQIPGVPAGWVNTKNQITVKGFVEMILQNTQFPDEIEKLWRETEAGGDWTAPPNRKPCPANLKEHPAEFSKTQLAKGAIPKPITDALTKAGWKSKSVGASNPQANGKAPTKNAAATPQKATTPNAKGSNAGKPVTQTKPTPKEGVNKPKRRDIYIRALANRLENDRQFRMPEDYQPLYRSYARSAKAEPEWYFDDEQLFGRGTGLFKDPAVQEFMDIFVGRPKLDALRRPKSG